MSPSGFDDGGDEFVSVAAKRLAEAYGEKTFSNLVTTIVFLFILPLVIRVGDAQPVIRSAILKTSLYALPVVAEIISWSGYKQFKPVHFDETQRTV